MKPEMKHALFNKCGRSKRKLIMIMVTSALGNCDWMMNRRLCLSEYHFNPHLLRIAALLVSVPYLGSTLGSYIKSHKIWISYNDYMLLTCILLTTTILISALFLIFCCTSGSTYSILCLPSWCRRAIYPHQEEEAGSMHLTEVSSTMYGSI